MDNVRILSVIVVVERLARLSACARYERLRLAYYVRLACKEIDKRRGKERIVWAKIVNERDLTSVVVVVVICIGGS